MATPTPINALPATTSTQSGCTVQISAKGPQNIWEDAKAVFTLWREVIRRHTTYAVGYNVATFQSSTQWGTKLTADIPIDGDLIWKTWLVMGVSAIQFVNNVRPPAEGAPPLTPVFSAYFPRLCPITSSYLTEFKISGQRIDFYDYLTEAMWYDATELVGQSYGPLMNDYKSTSDLIRAATQDQVWYKPLHNFTEYPQTAYPHIVARGHYPKYEITLQPKYNNIIICRYNNYAVETLYPSGLGVAAVNLPTNIADPLAFPPATASNGWNTTTLAITPVQIQGGDLVVANLLVSNVYLGDAERIRFTQRVHRYLIDEWQIGNDDASTGNRSSVKSIINFNHVVTSIFCLCQTNNAASSRHFLDWSNGNAGVSPIFDISMTVNNLDRLLRSPFQFLSIALPNLHLHHPSRLLYAVIPFSLHIDRYGPWGGINLSMIDTTNIVYDIVAGPNTANGFTCVTRGRNKNVLTVSRRLTGKMWA